MFVLFVDSERWKISNALKSIKSLDQLFTFCIFLQEANLLFKGYPLEVCVQYLYLVSLLVSLSITI